MPSNNLTLVVQVDSATANKTVANFNKAVASIETTAGKAGAGASRSIQGFERTTVSATARITSEFRRLASVIGATSIAAVGTQAVRVAADFEIARVGMEALIGSAEKGQQVFKELQQFAFESPFQFRDLLLGAQRLSAVQFKAEEILPTLKAVSTAVAAIGGPSADRLNDVIRAFGDIRAAGRLTGEEFRQLKNTAIPVLDILSKRFQLAPKEVKEAIEAGKLGAEETIGALTAGMEELFGKFQTRILGTFSVAVSNLVDALSIFAAEIGTDVLPILSAQIRKLNQALGEFTVWFKENKDLIFALTSSFAKLSAVIIPLVVGPAAIKGLIGAFTGLANATKGLAILKLVKDLKDVAAFLGGTNLALTKTGTLLLSLGKASPYIAAATAALWGLYEAYKWLEGPAKPSAAEQRVIDLAERMQAAGRIGAVAFETIDGQFKFTQEQIQRFVRNLPALDPTVLRIYRDELQKLGYAEEEIAEAYKRSPAFVLLEESAGAAEEAVFSLGEDLDEIPKKVQQAYDIFLRARNEDLGTLPRITEEYRKYREELGVTAEALLYLDEAEFLTKARHARGLMQSAASDRVKEIEEERKARLDFQTDQFTATTDFEAETAKLRLDNIQSVLFAERDAIDYRRNYQLRQLEGMAGDDVASQIQLTQQKLKLEQEYYAEREKLDIQLAAFRHDLEIIQVRDDIAAGRREQEVGNQRILALEELKALEIRDIRLAAARDISVLEIDAANRSREIVASHTLDVFNDLKSSAGRVFDALLHKSESIWDAMANALKTAILTVIKEIVTSQIALQLTRMLTGNGVAFGGGGGGTFGRVLGGLGVAAPMFGGGVGYPGAPGGTPGFTGPVQSVGALGQYGGVGGGNPLGMLSQLGNLGRGSPFSYGPGQIGPTQPGAGFGGATGGAMLLGGGMLALAGLQRGGKLGIGMTTAGGALIGAKFGGPIGALIGGAIGFGAGLIRSFIKSAEEKARQKIRAVYGITIQEKNILRQVVEIAKSGFGGNLDLAIRSEQVRELIELYALSTGQPITGGLVGYRPTSLVQSGGKLSSVTAAISGTALSGTRAPVNSPQPVIVQSLTLQVNGQSAADALEGRVAPVITKNSRLIQESSLRAQRSNVGRRDATALQFAPGLVT